MLVLLLTFVLLSASIAWIKNKESFVLYSNKVAIVCFLINEPHLSKPSGALGTSLYVRK